jgi:type I restriction enzyme S subunit
VSNPLEIESFTAPWTKDAPSSWHRTYLGHLVDVRGGATPSKDQPSFWDGEIPWVSPKDMKILRIADSEDHVTEAALSASALRWIAEGSVLMVTRGMILDHTVPIALTERPLTINQDMKALVPRGDLRGHFLMWLLVGLNPAILARVEEAAHGTKALRTEQWRKLPLAIPPKDDQHRIADFLDRKTASIDTLIEKQEQLLALLAEKRQALITQAVTKGLDPNAPMKDSGVEWLGRIPSHWTVKKLGLLLRGIEQGWSPECISRPPEPGEWGVLKAGAVNSGVLDEMESKALPDDLEPIPTLEVRPGDILMSRASGSPLWVGSVGIVRATARRLILCDKLYRLAIDRQQLEPEYAVLVLRSPAVRQLIDAGATGQSTLRNIGQDFVRGIVFAWPPFEEQQRIVEHVQSELRGLDALSQRVQAMIEKLREYRQALITAAVTGQLDVTATEAEQAANVVEAATA